MSFSGLSTVPAVLRFPIGLLAALPALFVMDRVMTSLPEGTSAPAVAAGVLSETAIDDAPTRVAAAAHYLAGLGTGLLFVYFSLVAEAVLGGSSFLSVAATTVVLYVLMVAFFLVVPLPRAPGVEDTRRRVIGRDWAISAAAYLAVLAPLVVGLTLAAA